MIARIIILPHPVVESRHPGAAAGCTEPPPAGLTKYYNTMQALQNASKRGLSLDCVRISPPKYSPAA